MHVITQKRIWEAKSRWPQSALALDQWYRLIKHAEPANFAELKAVFPSADWADGRCVFDIGGNKLRLIADVRFSWSKLFILGVMDHAEYDQGKWKRR